MLKLKPSNVTPVDKFRFRFPDGYTSIAFNKDDWFRDIDKHYKDNGYPQPDNWKELAEDALCRTLSGEWCVGGDEYSFINPRFTQKEFEEGMKTLVSSGNFVSKEQAEERALICSRCVLNIPVQGCASCNGRSSLIGEFQRVNKTSNDHLLKVCGISHRANQTVVWSTEDDLSKSTTPEMRERYGRIEECWQNKMNC